jgi:CheY-like chemotaxis protein
MGSSETGGRAVLIVEDEALVRMDVASVLAESGFVVYEAGDADEAIGLLEEHRDIRLVLTDIHMPGSMDGLKLAHYVRERWPPIRIIVASGQAMIRDEDMPPGGVFLAKPYRSESIASKVREMVGEAA